MLYEFGLEGIVRVFCWGTDEEVPDFDRELGRKGGDHIIEVCFLRGDASGVELCFDLGEPNGRVSWPERWQFDADSCNGCVVG